MTVKEFAALLESVVPVRCVKTKSGEDLYQQWNEYQGTWEDLNCDDV